MSETYAVIMAGGSGTRFWPASRVSRPKQFLPIASDRPMIADTAARLEGLVPAERVLVVTAAGQGEIVRECLPNLPEENLLIEPEARNTAPCIALAALDIERRDPDAVQIVLAADHVIEPADSFHRTVRAATAQARSGGHLITLGIRPTYAATGYGYIRSGDKVGEVDGIPVFEVARFVEKPDRASADSFVKSGRFYWNSGMFIWSISSILEAFRSYMPEVYDGLRGARDEAALRTAYASFEPTPVDKGILERTDNALMLPIDYRWSDVGSWTALASIHPPDDDGNFGVLTGGAKLVAEDARGCIAYAEGERLVALIGVHDLIVVQAGNATLVCPRDRAEDVKALVERLRAEGRRFL